MRRRPRVKREVRPRATLFGLRVGAFFRRAEAGARCPTCPWTRPNAGPAPCEEQAPQPLRVAELAVLQPEAPGLEVGEHRLDAPSEPVIEGAMDRWRLGQGDEPGLGMAGLMHHGDVGDDPPRGQLNA